jgi:hypothetical protein
LTRRATAREDQGRHGRDQSSPNRQCARQSDHPKISATQAPIGGIVPFVTKYGTARVGLTGIRAGDRAGRRHRWPVVVVRRPTSRDIDGIRLSLGRRRCAIAAVAGLPPDRSSGSAMRFPRRYARFVHQPRSELPENSRMPLGSRCLRQADPVRRRISRGPLTATLAAGTASHGKGQLTDGAPGGIPSVGGRL